MQRYYLILLVLFTSLIAQAEEYRIDNVEVQGNRRVTSAALMVQVASKPGAVSSDQVSEDIRKIFKTGFFDQVSASVVSDGGKNTLRFVVVEKPIVRRVLIEGNDEDKIGDDEVLEVLNFAPRRPLDRGQVSVLKETVRSFYESKGYYDATVEYSVVPVAENQVDLSFTVQEGEKFKIRGIEVLGLENVDPDDLVDSIQTTTYKWWSSWLLGTGRLNSDMLDNDRQLMRQYFLDNGYVDASVSEPAVEKREDGLYLTFRAKEGPQYRIGSVTASGDLVDGDIAKTLEGSATEVGEVFSATKVRQDTFAVSDKFSDVGYAFVNVVPDTKIDRENVLVHLDYKINKGNFVTVNQINIRGNDKTYDNIIRRELTIEEQEPYSSSKITRSQKVLQRSGLFEESSITTEQIGKDDQVDLGVNVREASTGTLSVGAGYSSSDGAIVNLRVQEANLFGSGKNLNLNVDFGSETNNMILGLEERHMFDSDWSGEVSALATEREYSDFDKQERGGSFGVGYPLENLFGEWAEDLSFGIKYELLAVEISDVDDEAAEFVQDSEGDSTVSAFTPRITRNTINNPLNPSSGSRQVVSVELAGAGGSETYYILEAVHSSYSTLWDSELGKFIFAWRLRAGYGEASGEDRLPLYRRYFPGGINTVRGYESRTLGPKDEDGNEYGGSSQLVNNLEIIFPLIESAGIRGLFFYDAGEAFDDDVSIDVSELREAWGTGIRWTSPLGPIRIEFGFPIDREEDEDSMVTLFSFGAPL